MSGQQIEALTWPASRLGDAITALALRAGISSNGETARNPADASELRSHERAAAWIEWVAERLGCEADPVETTLGDLEEALAGLKAGVLRISAESFLAITRASGRRVRVIAPNGRLCDIRTADVCDALRRAVSPQQAAELARLFTENEMPTRRELKAADFLLREQFRDRRFNECWSIRAGQAKNTFAWLRQANAIANGALLGAAHVIQYLLWLASWAILGRLWFAGRMDRGWLLAWALLLVTLVPFRLLTTWAQGVTAIGIGGLLKRRLLAGAFKLEPEEIRHAGTGTFLGQALEAEAVETLAMTGGVQAALATLELVISGLVLGRYAVLLAVWSVITLALGWRFWKRNREWTDARLAISRDLIECMVGHRTRVAQQRPSEWHESEDQALRGYIERSHALDRSGTLFVSATPRGWLLVGLAGVAPAIVAGHTASLESAVVLGGVLLAYTAFRRFTGSFTEIVAACVAWRRIAPLFRASTRAQVKGEFPIDSTPADPGQKIIEADHLTFRYRPAGKPVVEDCDLTVRAGDRILIEGPSGSGKTTFASILAGLREPESGLLLADGLDRRTLGVDQWRKRVTAAPQFHENHIVTETLGFNLLMGRGWPPTAEDLAEAEAMCRRLGLGDLLDRMPSGLQQMVGEGGWQLSHGERSRVYIARALLQRPELAILDESFAALDPENLQIALECTLEHAPALMVIAHP